MLSVSNYHYIRTSFDAPFPSIFGIIPEAFRKQLLLLKNEGDFISSIDLLKNFDEVVNYGSNYSITIVSAVHKMHLLISLIPSYAFFYLGLYKNMRWIRYHDLLRYVKINSALKDKSFENVCRKTKDLERNGWKLDFKSVIPWRLNPVEEHYFCDITFLSVKPLNNEFIVRRSYSDHGRIGSLSNK